MTWSVINLAHQLRGNCIADVSRDARVYVRSTVNGERHVILKIRTVGDVVVHEKIWQPVLEHAPERACFWSLGFHVVPVQVQAGAVGTPAHFFRAVLVDAVVGRQIGKAIGVVDRDKDEHGAVKQRGLGPGDDHVAQQRHRSILAVHLACVDGVLYEHDGPLGCMQGCGVKYAIA